jgi:hypothetical protein
MTIPEIAEKINDLALLSLMIVTTAIESESQEKRVLYHEEFVVISIS